MVRVGILLVLAAFLAVAYPEKETVFRPGKEYVFEYESQVLSGVPVHEKVLSGVKVKAMVRMQMKSSSRVHLQMEDIKIMKVMDEFTEPYSADDILPMEMFAEVTGKYKDIMEEHLLKPIKFRYADGHVSDIEVHPSDPYFSLNVKKGLLSLLHINMQEIGAIDDTPADLVDILTKNSYVKEPAYHGVFSAMEEGIDGICESIYAIVDSPDAAMITPFEHMDAIIMKDYSVEGPAMKVVKVRNYEKCKKRPAYLKGIFSNSICAECSAKNKKDVLTSAAHIDYLLTGNRHNFLIHKAVATGKHKISPLMSKETQPEVTVKQFLKLMKVQAPSVTIKPGSALITVTNMAMELPSHLTDGVAPFIGHDMPYEVDKMVEAAESLLDEAASLVGEKVDPKATKAIIELIHVAKKIPAPALAALIIKYAKEAASKDPMLEKKKKIILDIIPALEHPGSVMVMKKLIMEDVISEKLIATKIHQLALTMVPGPKMILELLEFAQDDIVKDPLLKKACILAVGTFTHKLYHTAKNMVDPYKKIVLAEKHKIANEIRKLLDVTVTKDAKIIVLKAIGNAGLPELMPQLKTIIEDKTKPVEIKKHAIYALRKIAPIMKKKIHSLLLPKFMDPNEPEEVRIAAFVVIMDSEPGVGIAQMIVHSLKTETSLQVGSLVYSYLKSLSYAKYPHLYKLAHVLKVALMSAKPFTPGIQYSKAFHWDIVSKNMAHGFAIDEVVITGYKSLLPSTLISKFNILTQGYSMNVLEVGVETHGLSALLADLIGPGGMLKEWLKGNADFKDIVKPIAKKAKMLGIADIAEKLKIAERLVAKFKSSVYLKSLGNELTNFVFNADYMEDIIEKATMKLPELVSKLVSTLKAGYHLDELKACAMEDNSVKIPSVVGLPIHLKMGIVAVTKIDGYIKVEGLPSAHALLMKWKAPSEAKVHLKLKPSMAIDVYSFLGVDATILKAGTGYKSDVFSEIPADLKIVYKHAKRTIAVEYEVPQEEKTLLKIAASPVAYMKKIPLIPEATVKPIEMKKISPGPGLAYQTPVVASWGEKSLGVGIGVAGNLLHFVKYPGSCTMMAGPQDVAIKLYPGSDVPDKIEMKIISIPPGHETPTVSSSLKSLEDISSSESKEESYLSLIGWGWGSEEEKSSSSSVEYKGKACEWSPVVPDAEMMALGINPAIKHELVFAVRTKGDEIKRYLAAKVACMPAKMSAQVNMQLIASPAIIPYKQYQKVAVDMVIKIPKYLFYEVPVPFMPEAKPIIKTAVICGAEGYTKKMIDAEVVCGKTVYDKLAGFTPIEAAIKVKYIPDSPIGMKKIGVKILDWMKDMPFYIGAKSKKHMYAENPPYKAEIKAYILPEENVAKMFIETPWETNIYSGISIPEVLMPKKGWKVPIMHSIADHYTSHKLFPGQCKIEGDKVITFDKVKFSLPKVKEADCEMVLAKDCTAAATFAVTAKKEKDHETKMAVKVMGPDDMIVEVIPTGSGWLYGGDSLVVKIKGEKKMMMNPIIVREEEGKMDSPVTYVVKKDKGVVVIDAKILGVTVITNGDEIEIKASPLFHGKTCGICGDYDGEMAWEFRGPKNEMYHKGEKFAVSYMIPDDVCKLKEVKEHYKMDDVEIPVETGACGVLMKHAIKEEIIKGEPKKCISIVPVEMCGLGCMEHDASTKTVPFHCLPAEDPATDHIIRKARHEGLEDWSDKAVDVYGTVTAPAMCVPVY